MKFQQLRYLVAVHESGLNITAAARQLHTSQPGVSRQLKLLEEELGFQLFEREGRALTRTTAAGEEIISRATSILREMQNIRRTSAELRKADGGTLSIATTHTQARYVLPQVVQAFRSAFPAVRVALQQSSPEHIAEWVLSGKADIGIATEGLSQFDDLISFPCYTWNHVVVVPEGHALLKHDKIGLEELASYPLITYDIGFTGRSHIDAAFKEAGLDTDIVLTAMDSDVIQKYVALGLGVGIVASMASEDGREKGLRSIEATHMFAPNVTRLAVRRGAYLRSYAYDFILRFAPELKLADIEHAMSI